MTPPTPWRSLLLGCGGRRFALRVLDVVEVCRPQPIAALPGVPAFVLGVTTLRGQTVPVVDLAKLLDASGECDPTLFVTVRVGARQVALAVGEVLGIHDLGGRIDELPPLVSDSGFAGIEAVTRLDGDLVEVLRHARLVPSTAWKRIEGGAP